MTPKHCKAYLNPVQKTILLNKEVIAINQDVTPQGFPTVAGDSSVWARNLSGALLPPSHTDAAPARACLLPCGV